jgi:hypothetical protein
MMWLFGQVFVWCLVSFVAGSAVTATAFLMQRRLTSPPAVVAEPTEEPKGVKKIVEMEPAE